MGKGLTKDSSKDWKSLFSPSVMRIIYSCAMTGTEKLAFCINFGMLVLDWIRGWGQEG